MMNRKLLIVTIILLQTLSVFSIELNNTFALKYPSSKKGALEDFRFGGGIGTCLYLTNQMDYSLTMNYGDFREIIPAYFGGVYKVLNDDFEVGFQFKTGHLLTLKSENTQGSTCDFNEGQFNVNYSFNQNVGLTRDRYTVNAQIGIGATQFRSKYFSVNTAVESIDQVFSTVGYEGTLISSNDQANKQVAIIGNFGLVLGYRLSERLCVYWENSVNISTSNKMSGNLYKRSWIPPDGYFFSGIGIYFKISPQKGRLGCPKF